MLEDLAWLHTDAKTVRPPRPNTLIVLKVPCLTRPTHPDYCQNRVEFRVDSCFYLHSHPRNIVCASFRITFTTTATVRRLTHSSGQSSLDRREAIFLLHVISA